MRRLDRACVCRVPGHPWLREGCFGRHFSTSVYGHSDLEDFLSRECVTNPLKVFTSVRVFGVLDSRCSGPMLQDFQTLTGHFRFSTLTALAANGIWRNVAVPSRLYAGPSSQKPLAGVRVSVKDNFRLADIKTTMTNRGFVEIYPVDSETAAYVSMVLHLGAVVVGKTRMCSFAAGEEPTDQWIDFHCPFSPRGDAYQSPGSSSSGAATSLAGYTWLDYSIGTDSNVHFKSIHWQLRPNGSQRLVAFEDLQQTTVCTVSDLLLEVVYLMVLGRLLFGLIATASCDIGPT